MIKQFFPNHYLKIRNNKLLNDSKHLVKYNINDVLDDYNYAIEK